MMTTWFDLISMKISEIKLWPRLFHCNHHEHIVQHQCPVHQRKTVWWSCKNIHTCKIKRQFCMTACSITLRNTLLFHQKRKQCVGSIVYTTIYCTVHNAVTITGWKWTLNMIHLFRRRSLQNSSFDCHSIDAVSLTTAADILYTVFQNTWRCMVYGETPILLRVCCERIVSV